MADLFGFLFCCAIRDRVVFIESERRSTHSKSDVMSHIALDSDHISSPT